jgi:hypothetical protein
LSTGDAIALASVVVAAGSAPFTIGAWRSSLQRRHVVRRLVAAGDRYLAASGDAAQVMAERSEARNEVEVARNDAKSLGGSWSRKAQALFDAMASEDNEETVRAALASIRATRMRWVPQKRP